MTTPYSYPQDVYDTPKNLLAVLGSWWADQYTNKDQMAAVVDAASGVQQQSTQDLLELLDSMGRYTVPIYHTDNWYELRLSQLSQTEVTAANVIKYDTDVTYDSGYSYDSKAATLQFSHPLPTGLVAAPLIMNRFTDPDLLWEPQLNYQVTDTAIVLYADPFADARILKQPIYKDGLLVDYIAILWVYRGQWDWDTIYKQFGYVLKLRMQSSRGYRDMLNATYDAMLNGGAGTSLKQMLSAMTGIPLTLYADEAVLEITQDSGGQLVITDKAAYRLSTSAELAVVVGDILPRQHNLTTAVQIYELNRRQAIPDIAAITLSSGFLVSCMYGDLLFPNRDVPMEVITDDLSGFTKLRWSLGGFPLDVDKFFDDLHDRGVASAEADIDACDTTELLEHVGEITEYGSVGISRYVRKATLAHLLDTRVDKVGEPTADSLPSVINPCQFLIDNVLNKHTTVVVLRTAGFGDSGIGLQNLRLLHRILPPQSAVLLMIEADVSGDTVNNNNFNDALATWVGAEIMTDVITSTAIADRGLTIRTVYGV